jgi:hypothetical protein
VDISGSNQEVGFYSLNNGYSHATGSESTTLSAVAALTPTDVSSLTEAQKKVIRFDPDLLALDAAQVVAYDIDLPTNFDRDNLIALDVASLSGSQRIVRRLTSLVDQGAGSDPKLRLIAVDDGGTATAAGGYAALTATYARADAFGAGPVSDLLSATPLGHLRALVMRMRMLFLLPPASKTI